MLIVLWILDPCNDYGVPNLNAFNPLDNTIESIYASFMDIEYWIHNTEI